MSWTDLEPDEEALLKELALFGPPAAGAGHCPEPELVSAAGQGVLPARLAGAVTRHVEQCAPCRALQRDLAALEPVGPTAEERRRIEERIEQAVGRRWWTAVAAGSSWRWALAAAAAVLVVAAVAGGRWWLTPAPVATPARLPWPTGPTAPVAAQYPLEKPPVRVPLAAVLVWRGASSAGQDRHLAELGEALVPYQADDFAEAARRLQALTARRTDPEADFYLGVCRLFLADHAGAVAALRRARAAGAPAMATDASWYLGMAYLSAGQHREAATEFRDLCAAGGAHQAAACDLHNRLILVQR